VLEGNSYYSYTWCKQIPTGNDFTTDRDGQLKVENEFLPLATTIEIDQCLQLGRILLQIM